MLLTNKCLIFEIFHMVILTLVTKTCCIECLICIQSKYILQFLHNGRLFFFLKGQFLQLPNLHDETTTFKRSIFAQRLNFFLSTELTNDTLNLHDETTTVDPDEKI